jgi:hypothetical protein
MGMMWGTWKVRVTKDKARKLAVYRLYLAGEQKVLLSLVLLSMFCGSAGGSAIVRTLVDAVRNLGDGRVIGKLKINWK